MEGRARDKSKRTGTNQDETKRAEERKVPTLADSVLTGSAWESVHVPAFNQTYRPIMNEHLTKATHTAAFLANDLRAAHSEACHVDPLLEILLLDLIGQATEIGNKLKRVELALQQRSGEPA